jgi:adenylate cyclase
MERKLATVLFADLVGSTQLLDGQDPEITRRRVTSFFDGVQRCIETHGGTVEKFAGDAVMAAFGIPIAHEDDADRAMACALDQLAALEKLNVKWQEQGRPELGIGIGINFGEVFAGNIGSDRRLEYTVIGDAVNTASRLCSIAGGNQILISEPFYQQLKQPPKVEPLEPIQVKGKSKKVPVYRVKR